MGHRADAGRLSAVHMELKRPPGAVEGMKLRAGIGHPAEPECLPAGVEDVAKRMMALTVSLVGKAGENAAVYAVHAGRRTVSPADINRALQYQAKTFLATVTEDEVGEALEDVDRACAEDDDSAEDSSDAEDSNDDAEDMETSSGEDEDDNEDEEEDEDEEEEEEDDEEEDWTVSSCRCTVCAGMNEAHDTWDAYQPEDEALQYLKHVTNKILSNTHDLARTE